MAVYERFKAWQHCHELAVAVYDATKTWPKAELFGLVSQARRAAHSAAANIAEGSAKRGAKEFRRYLDITLGSLSELSYTLRLARDLKILSDESWNHLEQLHKRAGGMTWLLLSIHAASQILEVGIVTRSPSRLSRLSRPSRPLPWEAQIRYDSRTRGRLASTGLMKELQRAQVQVPG